MKQLFSKDSTGKIRVWAMEQNGNQYRTHSGVIDGKIVISDWTTCEGKNTGKKNGTDGVAQCVAEIKAKYKKQLKSGYFENIEDVDKVLFVEPMLAKKFKDYANKIDFSKGEYVCQCKFNGIRCVAKADGLFTRTGEPILSIPHIYEALKPFFEKYPDAVLDGEAFNDDLRERLNEINELVRKTVHITQEDLILSEQIIKFYVYDGYNFGESLESTAPYYLRKSFIDTIVTKFKYVEHVKTDKIKSLEDFMKIYDGYVEQKHEGAMLRVANSPYEIGKRSKYLLKFKPTDDAEFTFLGVSEGKGNWSGMAKIIHLEMDNGEKFDATFKGTQVDASRFLNSGEYKKWIGKKVTIYFNGLTAYGVPNYAQFDYKNFNKQ